MCNFLSFGFQIPDFFSKENLRLCEKGCGLNLCSDSCENSLNHIKECKILRDLHLQKYDDFCSVLYENFTPIRSLLLNDADKEVISCLIAHDREEHGHEIDTLKKKLGFQFKEDDENFLKNVCRALDANAFEVALGCETSPSSVKGLYPLGSLANHSCVPNTMHVFNEKREMIVKAAVFIPKNSEIFHSYTRIIWGTITRLFHLHNTKHFICKCPRCKDPKEFGTYMSAILCKLCKGVIIPVNQYKAFGKWQCQDCKNVIAGKEIGELMSLLGSILRDIRNDDFPFMYRFLQGKLKSVVPEYNQVTVELKYKIVWILGYKSGYSWNELSLEQLRIKEDICQELLLLLEKLRCGQSKMRGLLLYELFCCKREITTRTNGRKQGNVKKITQRNCIQKENVLGFFFQANPNIEALFSEAASILEYDITAPMEIKTYRK
ncbi:hypothetical protein ABEB36_009911 [Hypothenemus hampei]|uniref:SET domain-containing protein n=1 Tax=Hypothenemus hampei TaxID=57062 RepID=A0ABD1EK05_HYPHA